MNPIIDKLNLALKSAKSRLYNAKTDADIEAVRVDMFGRKGVIPVLTKNLTDIAPSERPAAGKALNSAKEELAELFEKAMHKISGDEKPGKTEEILDLTFPGRKRPLGRKHPVSKVIDDCVAIFRRMGFIVAEGPVIETEYYNFDALNTPPDHPSRDIQDTFYLSDGRLLRTQTSPVQIRVMQKQRPPVRIVAPGACFRRDTPDATHGMEFQQIEGLYINNDVSMADLKSTLLFFAHELFGTEVNIRLRPHFFPFTEPSVECDFSCILCNTKGCRICKYSGWLEIAGAGMVDPAVLKIVGYDPEEWSGYAFGMGIERLAMIRYRINDIRLLYENDIRFLKQF